MNFTLPVPEAPLSPARLTSEDFGVLFCAGMLARLTRPELRDGMICEMNPQFTDHSFVKDELFAAIYDALSGTGLRVFSETSLRVDEYNMPTPDLAVCTAFARGGPIPIGNARLLVEVSVNSLGDDLGRKRALYAGAGVPEYWVVDVLARAIHVFADPAPDRAVYGRASVVAFGAPVTAQTVAGLTIDTMALV